MSYFLRFNRLSFLMVLILFGTLASCSEDPTTDEEFLEKISTIDAPKELSPTLNKLQTILEKNKKPRITNLVIRFSANKTLDYENEARGFCLRVAPTPIIYLYERDWLGEKAKPRESQEMSLIHLIGHCVYNLKHEVRTVEFKDNNKTYHHPISLMYSNFNWGKFSPHFLEKNQDEYQEKLITHFVTKEIK